MVTCPLLSQIVRKKQEFISIYKKIVCRYNYDYSRFNLRYLD